MPARSYWKNLTFTDLLDFSFKQYHLQLLHFQNDDKNEI